MSDKLWRQKCFMVSLLLASQQQCVDFLSQQLLTPYLYYNNISLPQGKILFGAISPRRNIFGAVQPGQRSKIQTG
jgi:hypothetical protein